MDEDVADAAVPDQYNGKYIESEVLPRENMNVPEDLDAESSAHLEVNKYQDAVSTADPEGPEGTYGH